MLVQVHLRSRKPSWLNELTTQTLAFIQPWNRFTWLNESTTNRGLFFSLVLGDPIVCLKPHLTLGTSYGHL
jgi:hypothetical protein